MCESCRSQHPPARPRVTAAEGGWETQFSSASPVNPIVAHSVLPSVPPNPAFASHWARVPQFELMTSRSGVVSIQIATVVPAANPLNTPAAPDGPNTIVPLASAVEYRDVGNGRQLETGLERNRTLARQDSLRLVEFDDRDQAVALADGPAGVVVW